MPVNEEDVVNIMGGMPEGIRLNDHRRRLKNRQTQKKLDQRKRIQLTLSLNCARSLAKFNWANNEIERGGGLNKKNLFVSPVVKFCLNYSDGWLQV